MTIKQYIKARIRSFTYAFRGVRILFKEEANARIHLAAAIFVILAGLYFQITKWEWLMLIFCISSVIGAELMNTAIENVSDALTEDKNDKIKNAKDTAAATVLVLAIMSLIVGAIIFWPYMIKP